MMSDLPPDLVEEILSRVPATSLKRLLSTCKRWNALFKDRRFTQKHFGNAAKQSLVLTLKESRVFSASIGLNVAPPSIDIKVPLSLKDPHSVSEEVDISYVFHCDGLLLCTTKEDRIVVWNPCSGETRWIQTKPNCKGYSDFSLGHDNNKLCHAYKILRRNYQLYSDDQFCGFEIYELSSDSWRVLDDVTSDFFIRPTGVSLKGNAYWLSWNIGEDDMFVTTFDFMRERVRRLCLPTFQIPGHTCLSVVREEELSVLHQSYNTLKMEIWVTNKIDTGAALLWTKSFTVDLQRGSNSFPKFLVSYLIEEEKKVVVCCNVASLDSSEEGLVYTIEKYYAEPYFAVTTHVSWWPFICSYVPSLVQIQQS